MFVILLLGLWLCINVVIHVVPFSGVVVVFSVGFVVGCLVCFLLVLLLIVLLV